MPPPTIQPEPDIDHMGRKPVELILDITHQLFEYPPG